MADGSVAVDIRCAICGAVAMHIESTAPGDPLVSPRGMPSDGPPVPTSSAGIRTEAGMLNLWMALETEDGIAAARDAIESGDIAALMRIDPEIVPFYCRECEASYCEAHWTTRQVFDPEVPSWLEELRGRCPLEHERRIHD